jgi:hypothetical protein
VTELQTAVELPVRHHLQSPLPNFPRFQKRTIAPVNNSDDDDGYRNIAVNGLRPNELRWALNHDSVHGIAYAFKNPVAVANSSDDPDDDRQTYLVRIKRDDLATALGNINEWIVKNPGKTGIHAYGFLRALSREGLTERRADDEERR